MRSCSLFVYAGTPGEEVRLMMKKLVSLLLTAALMALLVCPASAQSGLMPYSPYTVIRVTSLTRAQADLVDFLYDQVMYGETNIVLPEDTAYDDASVAMNCLLQDYPETFHLAKQWSITYEQRHPEIARAIKPQYRMSWQEAEEIRAALYHTAQELISADPTALGLHDALADLVTYGGLDDDCYTAPGALLEGLAVCEGYAQALCLLYRMAGIPCGVISGDARDHTGSVGRHAWNVAYISGYTLIDATWDDQDRQGLNTRWYYGLSDEQMGVDHWPDADQTLPLCTDWSSWHRQNGAVISTTGEAYEALRRLVRYSGELNLRIASDDLYWQLAWNTSGFLDEYNNAVAREDAFYGSYSVLRSDAQRCVIITRAD